MSSEVMSRVQEPEPTVLRPAFDYAVAYGQLHEVVRAFLPEEMVEKAARALLRSWDDADEDTQAQARSAAEDALSAALAGRQVVPAAVEQPDDDEIALRLARGRQWLAQQAGERMGMPIPAWDDLTADEQKDAEWEARAWLKAAYNTGVTIVPARRQVVDLPEPDRVDHAGNPIWDLTDAGGDVTCAVVDGQPFVSALSPCDPAGLAESYGLALIAAARATRLRAAGSGSGEG